MAGMFIAIAGQTGIFLNAKRREKTLRYEPRDASAPLNRVGSRFIMCDQSATCEPLLYIFSTAI